MRKVFGLLSFFFGYVAHAQSSSNCFDIARRGTLSELSKLYKSNNKIVDAVDINGSSMLILATYYSNDSVAIFIADKAKDINYTSSMGTALMAAVVRGNIVIAQKLLEKHCDVNLGDANQFTALHYAVLFKNVEMVKLLLRFNPDLNLKNSNGVTAFELATKSNNEELAYLLKR